MAIDTGIPRSRRALLAGGVGGLAAVVAAALGRPLPADAASGSFDSGDRNTPAVEATHSAGGTGVYGDSPTGIGVLGNSTNGVGVRGWGKAIGVDGQGFIGVRAMSGNGIALDAASDGGIAVQALTSNREAVYASTGMTNRHAASLGRNRADGTGVFGFSGSGPVPVPPVKTGVFGRATLDASSRGVYGYSETGQGVAGAATSGAGVRGLATTGVGGYFSSTTGVALRTDGRVRLDKCAGVATIPATKSSVVVTPGIDLVATSAVVASLMGSAGGTTTVHRSVVNVTTNTITIYLTKAATQNVKVAWHVFG